MEFDIAVRSRVVIAAPAQIVWQQLEMPETWNLTIAGIERLAGEPGQVGETLRVMQRRGDQAVPTILHTLSIEPMAWRVQSLKTEASRAGDGYVIYTLEEVGLSTVLIAELVMHCVSPARETSQLSCDVFSRQASAATAQKMDEDLHRLKSLAERL